jgi:IS5 family transposase
MMQREPEGQMSFFEMAMAGRSGGNRVLEAIDKLVNFEEAQKAIEATYSTLGRPGHRVSVMLRIMILQHLYGLSDPQAEQQVGDRLSFQKFVGLGAQEQVPDETSICRFRERLIGCQMHERLLELLNHQLEAAGYMVRRTTLVDATLIVSSRKRVSPEKAAQGNAPDAQARFTRKQGRSFYGYKAHVSASGCHQLIWRARMTSANVDDSHVFSELIPAGTRAVYADKAYDSKINKQWLADHGIANGILKKAAHHIKLDEADLARNKRKARRRRHVERVFAHLKKWQHFTRARYVGLIKNQLELTLKAVAYNLKRVAALAGA